MVLAPFAVPTPRPSRPVLDERVGTKVFSEAGNAAADRLVQVPRRLQQAASIPQSARGGGVVAFSSGNHAQGVAAAAQILNMQATIVMPEGCAAVEARAHQGLWRRSRALRPRQGRPRSHRPRDRRQARRDAGAAPMTIRS